MYIPYFIKFPYRIHKLWMLCFVSKWHSNTHVLFSSLSGSHGEWTNSDDVEPPGPNLDAPCCNICERGFSQEKNSQWGRYIPPPPTLVAPTGTQVAWSVIPHCCNFSVCMACVMEISANNMVLHNAPYPITKCCGCREEVIRSRNYFKEFRAESELPLIHGQRDGLGVMIFAHKHGLPE